MVVALITALTNLSATRCSSGYEGLEAAVRQNHDDTSRRLDALGAEVRGLTNRIDKESTEQKNKDLLQDLRIEQKASK